MTADGYIGFCGKKSKGYIASIEVYAPGSVLVQPTAKVTAVDGVNRVVTFEGVNVAYSTDGGTTWTSSTEKTVEVTVSETTTFLVKSVDGANESDVTTFTVEAGTELSLAVPTFSITKMAAGFEKTYTVVCDNKDVLLNPTAKFTYSFEPTGDATAESDVEFNGTINASAAGVYTVTASCAGYTSTTLTIDNTKEYELAKTLDFTTIKAADLSANWTKVDSWTALPGSSSQWPAYISTATQGYFYNFASETAASTDVFEGLDCEISAEGKTLKFFEGLGVMYPIYTLNSDGSDNTSTAFNSGNIAIAGGTADHIGVYTYLNNYSKNGTKTSILTGDQPFALYRFSDLMTKVEIYAPKAVAVAEPVEAIFNWSDSTVTTSGKADRVFTVEGVTLTTTLGTNTNNAPAVNRAGEIRFYANNAMTIVAPAGMKIGRVFFYAGAYENGAGAEKLTYNGAAISDVWTLDTPAETVELSAAAKCSFKKIVVVCIAEGQTLPEYVPVSIANTLETAYTVAKAKELFAAGEDLKTWVYVKGFVTEATVSTEYGNADYFIADVAGDTENDIQVYRGYGLDSVKFAAADELMAGDEVVVYGQLSSYNGVMQIAKNSKIASIVKAQRPAVPVSYGEVPIQDIVIGKGLASGKKEAIAADTTIVCNDFSVVISAKTPEAGKDNEWQNYFGSYRLNMYSGSITFKANEGKVFNKISFPSASTMKPENARFTVDSGEVTFAAANKNTATWTGEAATVVFTITGTVNLQYMNAGEKPAVSVNTIAELVETAESGENATLNLNAAQVMYVNPKAAYDEVYVNDGTGSILLNKTAITATAGKAITGKVHGTYTKGANYFYSLDGNGDTAAKTEVTEVDGAYAAPVITDLATYSSSTARKTYSNQLVTLTNVFGEWNEDDGEGTLTQGDAKVFLKDKFISLEDEIPAYIEKISGILVYNTGDGGYYFCPISTDSITEGVVVAEDVANIAALAEKENNAFVKLALNDAVVTFVGETYEGKTAFVQDATGAVRFEKIGGDTIAANKALNGHVVAQLSKVEEDGVTLLTLKGISTTSAESAITATDYTFVAEVVDSLKKIEAAPANYVNKLITLQNVDVMDNWGDITLYQGDMYGYSISATDNYNTLGYSYVYPKKAEKFSGIFAIEDSWAVIYPVSADSIVAAPIVLKEIASIAELKALTTAEDVKLTADNLMVTVSETVEGWMSTTTTAIIEDATGAVVIEGSAESKPFHAALLSAGGVYNGSLALSVDASMVMGGGGIIIQTNDSTAASELVAVEGKVAEPAVMTMLDAQKEENSYRWIKFNDVKTIEGEYAGYFQFSDGTDTLDQQDPWMNLKYDSVYNEEYEYWEVTPVVIEKYEYLTAILYSSYDGYQLYPVSWKEATEGGDDEDITGVIYSWESPEGTVVEKGGKAVIAGAPDDSQERLNYKNADYYTLCLNGKGSEMESESPSKENNATCVKITLDQPLVAGDKMNVTAYLNKNEVKEATIFFDYGMGKVQVKDDKVYGNIGLGEEPTTHSYDIPTEAAGETIIRLSRNASGTNVFIIKLEIVRGENPGTGITDINAVVNLLNGDVYSINGVKVRNAGESLNGLKGLYIINGKKVVIK